MMIDIIRQYKDNTEVSHRENLGQFFTPPEVAHFMCKWVLAGRPSSIYDPAFGLGAFYFAAQSIDSNVPFHATELDPTIFGFFKSHQKDESNNLNIKCKDYLASWGHSYEAIVCNPPYMRFQKFLNRKRVSKDFVSILGIRLSGYTNIASAFLVKSLRELYPNGRLAYIMPLEFLNTGYGKVIKRELLRENCLKAIIKLEPEKDVFPDAITTAAIILASKDGRNDPVSFCSASSISELDSIFQSEHARRIARQDLNPDDKWLQYFEETVAYLNSDQLVTLYYYGKFSRGIATGANEFFSLSPSLVRLHKIPERYLRYCITRSAQVKSVVLTDSRLSSLVEKDDRVFVLDINGNLPAPVDIYLKKGEEKGYHQRYLTKHRKPWYKLEHRSPAPILLGVFSRDGFKVIRNYSSALNLTCYHGFYPNLFGERFIDHIFLYLRSNAAQHILGLSIRRYGDKLDKFEPNDLNSAHVPSPSFFEAIDPELIQKAMDQSRAEKELPVALEDVFGFLISTEQDAAADRRNATRFGSLASVGGR